MKRHSTILFGLLAGTLASQAFQGFGDLEFVAGGGANLSAVVIDFNDGASTESHVWGYRWDGAVGDVSGAQMLIEVAAADPLLNVSYFGNGASGFYVSAISYGGQSAANGDFVTNFDYWGYFIAGGLAGPEEVEDPPGSGTFVPRDDSVPGGGSLLPGSMQASDYGASVDAFGDPGRFIEDGSWDVWSFGPFSSDPYAPDSGLAAAAVPEPSFHGLVAGVFAVAALVRRFVVRKG